MRIASPHFGNEMFPENNSLYVFHLAISHKIKTVQPFRIVGSWRKPRISQTLLQ